jgi:hypothetical protein
LTAKHCRKIGPLLKTAAELFGQAADAVVTVDVGVLAHNGDLLFG